MSDGIEFTGVTPYLYYPDGDAAAEWLQRILGLGPARRMPGSDGSWAEGEVAVGPARVDISGGHDPGQRGGQGTLLIVGVNDVDAQYRRIKAAGVAIDPPRDEAYGPRTCHVDDPWGYRWYFLAGRVAVLTGSATVEPWPKRCPPSDSARRNPSMRRTR